MREKIVYLVALVVLLSFSSFANEWRVKLQEFDDYYAFPATVNYFQTIKILPKANGFVEKWNFKEGEDVKKGDVLFTIYAPEIKAKYEQAKKMYAEATEAMNAIESGIKQVKAGLELAEKTFRRISNLYKKGSASKQQYDQALAQYKQMKAKLDELLSKKKTVELKIAQAKAGLMEAQTYVNYLTVKAMYDGVVLQRNISEGDFVAPQMPMPAYVLGAYPLIVEAYLPESTWGMVNLGDKIRVKVEYQDRLKYCKVCEGTVIVKSKSVDPMSRTYKVKVQLPNIAKHDVVAGMYVKLLINVGKVKGLVVPIEAVKQEGEITYVKVKTSSGEVKRMIRLGRVVNNGKFVEVMSGLEEGETVVY